MSQPPRAVVVAHVTPDGPTPLPLWDDGWQALPAIGSGSSVGSVTDPADPPAPRPGSPGAPLWDPTAIPAATVIVLRDRQDHLEVLLLRRDRDLSFAGGTWVFPGGRIDPGDHPTDGDDLEAAARAAAAREAGEEAGLALDPAVLRRWTHWTPPPETPKRFTTAFYVAALPQDHEEVVIDDGEIREHAWRRPQEMLALHSRGHVSLTPPTYITLSQLSGYDTAAHVVEADRAVEHFATRFTIVDDVALAMYHGDRGYESGDPGPVESSSEGPMHRLLMRSSWTYVRDTEVPGV